MTSFLRVYCFLSSSPERGDGSSMVVQSGHPWSRHEKEKTVLFLVQQHRAVAYSRFLAFVFSIALESVILLCGYSTVPVDEVLFGVWNICC